MQAENPMDAAPAFVMLRKRMGRTSGVWYCVDILQTCKGCDTLSLHWKTDE